MPRRLLVAVLVALVSLSLASAAYAGSTWPVFHGNNQRTGNDTTEPSLLPLHRAWSARLDGNVYGQPLVYAGRVYAATENNTVYALDAHDGHVMWSRHIGPPETNVVAQSGCGTIDPLGITSTMVLDTSARKVFAVALIQDSNRHVHYQMVGYDAITGARVASANADPGAPQNSLYIQQRAGLALGNGRIYIGYGGHGGDCGVYHGWMVSLTEAGTGKVAFDVTPHTGLGAIWGTSGPAIDNHGRVFTATGNPDPVVGTHDYGESVLRFDATLHLTGVVPTFPGADADLGSAGPILLPNNMLFQIGKQQTGLLIDTDTMHVLHTLTVCPGEAFGGMAFDGKRIFVPCADRMRTVNVDVVHRTMSLGWSGPLSTNDSRCSDPLNNCGTDPPTLAGGVMWNVDRGAALLYGLNPATGAVRTKVQLGALPHFATPTAALGLLLFGSNTGVTALAGPSGVPAHASTTCVPPASHTGYWITSNDGRVYAFGGAAGCGSVSAASLTAPIVAMAGLRTGGYWLAGRDGNVYSFGTARALGSMHGHALARSIVGMAARPSGDGYWLVASDGGIFSFGGARYHGSTGGIHLAKPIVGMAATPSGNGYWFVASDGGIFSFGDAKYHGSTGGMRLARPIVGMVATPSGKGYWLVASDGGIFSFGDAKYHGSTGAVRLVSPIVGMTNSGSRGYWFVAGDGGVFAFDAPFRGSAAGLTAGARVVAMAHD